MWKEKKEARAKVQKKTGSSSETKADLKGKQKKLLKNTDSAQHTEEGWGDYYYMTPSVCSVSELASVLMQQGISGLELWPEMGVLEWPTAPERSIDLEVLEPFRDPEDAAFLKKYSIQSIFSLHISSQDEDVFQKYFAAVLERFSGAVCCDTDSFEPVVMGALSCLQENEYGRNN